MTSSVVLITFRHFNCVGESTEGRRDDDYMRARGDKKKIDKNVESEREREIKAKRCINQLSGWVEVQTAQ